MPKNNNDVTKHGVPRSQNLVYIRDMLGELRKVAEIEGADMLCYLIDMAYIESDDILSKLGPISSGIEDE